MKMKLKKMLKNISVKEVKGSTDLEITGICSNSKFAFPGCLFIARKGQVENGDKYIPEAISAGAVAIVTDISNPFIEATQVIHKDVHSIEGALAANYYQFPSDELFMVGITGTNGKTTTSFLVKRILDGLKQKSGLIGTIEYVIGDHRYPATRTTPDVIQNNKMLREMILNGCNSAVMEVSSHALDQNRVEFIDFDVSIFTNLTLDHLDYHETMEAYATAKNKLFTTYNQSGKKKKFGIANKDSPWLDKIVSGCPFPVLTYAIEREADIQAKNISLFSDHTTFDICYKEKNYSCRSPLIGRFNVYNYLAAIGTGLAKNESIEKLIEILTDDFIVPGRLEHIPNNFGPTIYVDFAHSDDALLNVLECLSEIKTKRIITVFGCGGDRDKLKRPKMAQVAEKFSDITIVTSDNPRTENPESIIKDIITGFTTEFYESEIDRYLAIKRAISLSLEGDIILIAGKGHETYQIFSHQTVPFDDRQIAYKLVQEKYAEKELIT